MTARPEAKAAPKAALIPRDRADLEAAFAELREAEDVLETAATCGDTHDACLAALNHIRRALYGPQAEKDVA